MSDTTAEPTVRRAADQTAARDARPRRLPPYNVVLANDDHHSMDFVVDVLRKVLGVADGTGDGADARGAHDRPGDHLDRAKEKSPS